MNNMSWSKMEAVMLNWHAQPPLIYDRLRERDKMAEVKVVAANDKN